MDVNGFRLTKKRIGASVEPLKQNNTHEQSVIQRILKMKLLCTFTAQFRQLFVNCYFVKKIITTKLTRIIGFGPLKIATAM